MKRQRHIRTHVLATLIGLTCGVLLVVILVFNLSIRGYIRARAAASGFSTNLPTVPSSRSPKI